jgi:hypothetical protein
MENNIDIKKMSVVELESLAYRQIVLLEQTQKNLQVLNNEINTRKEPKEE